MRYIGPIVPSPPAIDHLANALLGVLFLPIEIHRRRALLFLAERSGSEVVGNLTRSIAALTVDAVCGDHTNTMIAASELVATTIAMRESLPRLAAAMETAIERARSELRSVARAQQKVARNLVEVVLDADELVAWHGPAMLVARKTQMLGLHVIDGPLIVAALRRCIRKGNHASIAAVFAALSRWLPPAERPLLRLSPADRRYWRYVLQRVSWTELVQLCDDGAPLAAALSKPDARLGFWMLCALGAELSPQPAMWHNCHGLVAEVLAMVRRRGTQPAEVLLQGLTMDARHCLERWATGENLVGGTSAVR